MRAVILGLLLGVPVFVARGEEQTPAEEYRALVQGFAAAVKVPTKAYDLARTPEERLKASERWPWVVFAPRFLELAEAHPDDPAALDTLIWVVANAPTGTATNRAVEILTRDHIQSDRLATAFAQRLFRGGPAVMTLYRRTIEKSPHRAARALATLRLADLLSDISYLAKGLRQNTLPEAALRYWNDTVLREFLDLARRGDPDALTDEAVTLYNCVIADFADVKGQGGKTLGEIAEGNLSELRDLAIGHEAPDIEGRDIDGNAMRLADFRGKVVVVNFWSTSCGACMEMIPHERSLVKRLEGKPFVLLGVNDDEDRNLAVQAVKSKNITWRSWWDGGIEGPIVLRWNVRGWPTTYVLDDRGVIRFKNLRGQDLDRAVDRLVNEAESRGRGGAS
ncbi:TlpA family protein disulfide reductase [Singulisphaera sp. GP187]|uniref:TlpA family protein disulfide reductase n=1 Tax=Singulisphaera sp. GP187 TaxID=1882752 RepID=UPI001356322F|nr:TlpA disulfide reductase family protein [Singulisphaera sp. GP187]